MHLSLQDSGVTVANSGTVPREGGGGFEGGAPAVKGGA